MVKPALGCIIFPRLNKSRIMVWIERHFICYYEREGNINLCVFSYNACFKASRLLNYIENTGSYVTPNTTSIKIPIIYCCLVEQPVFIVGSIWKT
jgi:hypothetical protein